MNVSTFSLSPCQKTAVKASAQLFVHLNMLPQIHPVFVCRVYFRDVTVCKMRSTSLKVENIVLLKSIDCLAKWVKLLRLESAKKNMNIKIIWCLKNILKRENVCPPPLFNLSSPESLVPKVPLRQTQQTTSQGGATPRFSNETCVFLRSSGSSLDST